MLSTWLSTSISESLPNIRASVKFEGAYPIDAKMAFNLYEVSANPAGASYTTTNGLYFNASAYSAIYKDNSNVTPSSTKCTFLIRY